MTAIFTALGRILSIKTGLWLPFTLGLALCLSYGLLRAEKRHSAKVEQHDRETTAAYSLFAARVEAKSNGIIAKATATALRVNTAYATVQQEQSNAYDTRLAAYRVQLDRLRAKAGGTDSRSSGNALSVAANATGAAIGAGEGSFISQADLEICAVNTVKSATWLAWYRSVAAIPR